MIQQSSSILKRNKLTGIAICLSIQNCPNILKINNVYGQSANGLANFMFDILARKGLRPVGNKFVQVNQIKQLLNEYSSKEIENAMLKANQCSSNAWGIKFIRKLLDGSKYNTN